MTRAELVKIVEDGYVYSDVPPDEVVDRILAALDKEREGEVVLFDINEKDNILVRISNASDDKYKHFTGIEGQLIFRPTKEAK